MARCFNSAMRATLMYGAGDVRVEDVPDAHLIEPADALVRVTRAAICAAAGTASTTSTGARSVSFVSTSWSAACRRSPLG